MTRCYSRWREVKSMLQYVQSLKVTVSQWQCSTLELVCMRSCRRGSRSRGYQFRDDKLYDIKEMLRRLLRHGFRPQIIFKSLFYQHQLMEAHKEIKICDFNKDQYGDYPFIRSTYRSERVWTVLKEID